MKPVLADLVKALPPGSVLGAGSQAVPVPGCFLLPGTFVPRLLGWGCYKTQPCKVISALSGAQRDKGQHGARNGGELSVFILLLEEGVGTSVLGSSPLIPSTIPMGGRRRC